MLILFNILIPQVLWFPKIRANIRWLFLISLVILVGMWLERFVIIVTSLSSRLPAVVVGPLHSHPLGLRGVGFGTIGLFTTAMFIFIRIMPSISIFEMRALLPEAEVKAK